MKSLILFALLSMISATKYACSTPALVAPGDAALTSLPPCNTALWAKTYGPMKRFGDPPSDAAIAAGASPYVRSRLWHRCVQDVKGTVKLAGEQPDGDYKLLVELDNSQPTAAILPMIPLDRSEFYPAGNTRKWLAVEVVCAARPRIRPQGRDASGREYVYPNIMSPVRDHFCKECVEACMNYTNTIYKPRVGEVVYVTGELIRDRGAGVNPAWREGSSLPRYIVTHDQMEIHPATAITK